MTFSDPPSREQAALVAGQELGAYAFIRAWLAGDLNRGLLLLEQHHVPEEAAMFVLSLASAARRALLSVEGYDVDRAVTVLDQWMEDAAERASL